MDVRDVEHHSVNRERSLWRFIQSCRDEMDMIHLASSAKSNSLAKESAGGKSFRKRTGRRMIPCGTPEMGGGRQLFNRYKLHSICQVSSQPQPQIASNPKFQDLIMELIMSHRIKGFPKVQVDKTHLWRRTEKNVIEGEQLLQGIEWPRRNPNWEEDKELVTKSTMLLKTSFSSTLETTGSKEIGIYSF